MEQILIDLFLTAFVLAITIDMFQILRTKR